MGLKEFETRSTRKIFRKFFYPSLDEFSKISKMYKSAKDLLNDLYQKRLSSNLEMEYSIVTKLLETNYKKLKLKYPLNWKVEEESARLIYYLVRLAKPKTIVETGVANGHSTFIILKALEKNNYGTLTSIDISQKAGVLIDSDMKKNWNLVVIKPNAKSIRRFFEKFDRNIDIFIHDSNHSFFWQSLEYSLALPHMSGHSILLSDDIDTSYAFYNFCVRQNGVAFILYDNRKLFGLLKI